MHATIISSYTLQGSILANSFKRQNIECTVCSPEHLNFADKRTDAVIFPHLVKKEFIKKLEQFLKEISRNTPLIFIGNTQKNTFREKTIQRHLKQSIFLDENISNTGIINLTKDILVKTGINKDEKIKIGKITLDRKIRHILRKEKSTPLTRKEFFLLELLINNVGHITTRESIMEYVWDKRNFVAQNTIDVYISRLRKKLYTKSGKPKIETIPCLGYKLIL